MLHDESARAEIIERIQSLRPDSPRRWGRMTPDQMLWHVNQAMLASLGQLQVQPVRSPLPAALAKPMVMHLPWPRNVRTAPEWVVYSEHDFDREQKRYVQLVGDFTRRPLDERWPVHHLLGPISGRDWSCLNYKHADHHLRQFSV
jgi:hypothetical protein